MNNTNLLMVFFGVLGLVCLMLQKLIHVLYKEITSLGAESTNNVYGEVTPATGLNTIRIIGLGILAVVGRVYFF